MIIIRQDQLSAFKQASQADFERGLVRGLVEQFPHCRVMYTESALANMTQLGIEKAGRKGLESAADIQRYVWLMLLFGSHWERDPQVAWAATVLVPAEGTTPSQRIARLWEQAQQWRQRVMGPNDSLYLSALRNLQGKSVEDLCKNSSRSQRDLLIQLAAMYPRKFTEVGEPGLYDLTRLAVEACKPFELVDRWAVVLMAEFMFLLGAGFLVDPLHAWAGEALKSTEGAGIDQRLEALLRSGTRALAHMTSSAGMHGEHRS